MNLDTCTPGQRHVVTTLDAPLVVAAGAGSGKTFTLTQRIAWALLPDAQGLPPFADGVDEVMAITYTNKAAAELRSRVKQQLIEEGMVSEALKSDDAWISTIHGMCSRLLREHALEFGLDPAFELIMGAEADALFDRALREVYAEVVEGEDVALQRYLSGRRLHSLGFGGSSVSSDVRAVISCVRALPGGFDAYVTRRPSMGTRAILQRLYDLGLDFQAHASAWKKPTKTDQKNLAALEGALTLLEEALSAPVPEYDKSDFDSDWFLDLVFSLPPTTEKYRRGKDDEDFFADYRRTYGELGLAAQVASAQPERDALVRLARMVDRRYSELKGPGLLDNDDLISIAAEKLEEHPELARACREQFKLVMVDEFQDTNRVQVGLVRQIADPTCDNVCMVGDAQQSIYKFRGADVSVFFDFQEEMSRLNEKAEVVKLPDNFRSHADVLSVVDKVFSSDDFFGSRFLHLEPKGQVNNLCDPLFEERPRIEFFVAKGKGSIGPARLESARAVASHFADLRKAGANPGDMVLLLGTMSNATTYVDALSEEGFQSIITGGSVFAGAPEVNVVAELLHWWSNPLDPEALLALLTSPPFMLDEDTLLSLCHAEDGRRQSLAKGFAAARWSMPADLDQDEADRLAHVARVLWRGNSLARESCSCALERTFVDSGWASSLEDGGAQGLACAGNVLKAVEIVRSLEEGLSVAEVSAAFDDHLVSAKEAPGSLTTTSSQFVRIMTVHASKGLQFPHVALAELRMGDARGFDGVQKLGDSFVCTKRQTPSSSDPKKAASKLYSWLKGDPDIPLPDPETQEGVLRLAESQYALEEREEAQRLLYVGMTRPSKSLFVSCAVKSVTESSAPLYVGVRDVLGWEEDPSLPIQMVEYGGSRPARVCFVETEAGAGDEDAAQDAGNDGVAPLLRFDAPSSSRHEPCVPGVLEERKLWSYSSLSHASQNDDAGEGAAHVAQDAVGESIPDGSGASSVGSDFLSLGSNLGTVPDAGEELDSDEASGVLVHRVTDEEALSVDLGSAFHLLAERSIKLAARKGASRLERPSKPEVDRVAAMFGLSSSQSARLEEALDLWFGSDLAHELASCSHVRAEVPFVVRVPNSSGADFVLEGEIDALGFDDESGHALLIDYKTGGFPSEGADTLHEKHLLQAQCYAFDLLSSGFESVDACFVRVEQHSKEDSSEPEVVRYSFSESDRDGLARVISRCLPVHDDKSNA